MAEHTPETDSREPKRQYPISPDQNDADQQSTGKGHPPLKGTDTPAHTDLEYADREKGKRTTM